MSSERIERGGLVGIRDAFGKEHECWALTGVVRGHNFPVVWVSVAECWRDDLQPGGDDTYPWPAEDVWLKTTAAIEGNQP